MVTITLILARPNASQNWPHGNVLVAPSWDITGLITVLSELGDADFVFFWHPQLGLANPARVVELIKQPGDVFHAGLRLGMQGLPTALDHVSPTWMLACDPEADIEASSWRLSLEACLIRRRVLDELGFLEQGFQTLEAASLSLGHRWVKRGALMRHVPNLVAGQARTPKPVLPIADEVRFIYYRFGRRWTWWSLMRTFWERPSRFLSAITAWFRIGKHAIPTQPPPLARPASSSRPIGNHRVSVLIPTLNRNAYLRAILEQFRHHDFQPLEILVVDQTHVSKRDKSIPEDFKDLPLTVFYRDEPGQCSSRNQGLLASRGDYILFIDDDDEVPANLISAHLANLQDTRAEVSCGVADEEGAGPLPEDFSYFRLSDVFPTNNTLIRKDILSASGLFDLAFDRGKRADGDLGMRVYLSGALMVLNPSISVFHHHAPVGGLRDHKARVITFASSRTRLFHRHLPSVSEIYLAKRYFTANQLRNMLWLSAFGTLMIRGSRIRKLLKWMIGSLCMPHSIWKMGRNLHKANQMLAHYPSIPSLPPAIPPSNQGKSS